MKITIPVMLTENPFPRQSCKLKQSHKSPSEKPIQLKLPSDLYQSWQGLELPSGRQITRQIKPKNCDAGTIHVEVFGDQ